MNVAALTNFVHKTRLCIVAISSANKKERDDFDNINETELTKLESMFKTNDPPQMITFSKLQVDWLFFDQLYHAIVAFKLEGMSDDACVESLLSTTFDNCHVINGDLTVYIWRHSVQQDHDLPPAGPTLQHPLAAVNHDIAPAAVQCSVPHEHLQLTHINGVHLVEIEDVQRTFVCFPCLRKKIRKKRQSFKLQHKL